MLPELTNLVSFTQSHQLRTLFFFYTIPKRARSQIADIIPDRSLRPPC